MKPFNFGICFFFQSHVYAHSIHFAFAVDAVSLSVEVISYYK